MSPLDNNYYSFTDKDKLFSENEKVSKYHDNHLAYFFSKENEARVILLFTIIFKC